MNFTYTYLTSDIIYESVSCPDCDWQYGPVPMQLGHDSVNAAERHRESTGHSPEDEINVKITPGPKDPDNEDCPTLTIEQINKIRHLWEDGDDDEEEED